MARFAPLHSRPIVGHRSTEFGDTYLMVEAARGFFLHGRSQKEVAEDLGVSQATVSRLLARARDEGVIRFHLSPNPEHAISQELADKLEPVGVRSVTVVCGGTGKNEGNLSGGAAKYVMDCLGRLEEPEVRITSSSGETMHAVFESLIRSVSPSLKRTLELYPAALVTDHSVDINYPATLAMTLALHINRSYGQNYGGQDPQLSIRACAPSLPRNFYSGLTSKEREDYLERFELNKTMELALSAQIFLMGIGRANDEHYKTILERMKLLKAIKREKNGLDRAVAELCWVPIDAQGDVIQEIEDALVGVKPRDLREISKEPGTRRHVIAIAGGEAKKDAVHAALMKPCFTTLITDVVNARNLLASREIGIPR
jgi:deoxyribonucleoside regulator